MEGRGTTQAPLQSLAPAPAVHTRPTSGRPPQQPAGRHRELRDRQRPRALPAIRNRRAALRHAPHRDAVRGSTAGVHVLVSRGVRPGRRSPVRRRHAVAARRGVDRGCRPGLSARGAEHLVGAWRRNDAGPAARDASTGLSDSRLGRPLVPPSPPAQHSRASSRAPAARRTSRR